MELTYQKSKKEDIEIIFKYSKQLIDEYENISAINYEKVLDFVHKKIIDKIDEYNTIYIDNIKVGYFHFSRNEEGKYEIEDLYVFEQFRNKGIGSKIISNCLSSTKEPIYLFVFINNKKAISLYEKHGFKIIKNIKNSRYLMKFTHS
ncbi:MAG: GNAT family N-acetyltransferase [Bacilli bacterium]